MSRIWKVILWLFVGASAERTRGQFQDAESTFANMKINSVQKVKVEAISKAEAIRMRQTGLRFHEVEHHHFNDQNSRNGKLWQDLKNAAAASTEKESLPSFPWKKKKQGEDTKKEEKSSTLPKAKAKEVSSEEEEEVTNSSKLDTSLEEALMPKRKISPTRLGGFLCAQFDLDLFALSGGTFPGMIGVGLLGDIHYQPSTKCYGWTAEIYLMVSIGVGLWGMDFRVALVVIATLVVTERPLSAGAKDLVWELPPGFDTAHCMQSNPFKLITATTGEGWKFIYNHVLRKRYLKHAENEVQRYLKENKDEIADFQRYVDFIEPPQALPETITSPTQSRGLASTGIVASVEIKGRWGEDFIELEVIMPQKQRVTSSGVSGNIFQFVSEVRAKIWQEIGQVVLSQKSARCDWPKYDNFRCKFRFNARRKAMAYAQISFRTFQDFVAPVQIDSSDDEFSFPASVRASREPLAGTLSCQTLNVKANGAKDGKTCAPVESLFVQVQVGHVSEEATWDSAQFGEGSPWGIDISKDGLQGDHREIDELLAERTARTGSETANIRLYEFDNKVVLEFLSQLVHAKTDWCKKQDTFRHDVWRSLAKPTKSAAEALHVEALVHVVQKMMVHLQAYYRQKMQQQQEIVLVPSELSKSLEVPTGIEKILHQLKSRFSSFVVDCATQAVGSAMSKDADEGAFMHHLEACSLLKTKRTKEDAAVDVTMMRQSRQNEPSEGERVWKTFENRSVNTRSCTEEGLVSAGSAESCQRFCDEDLATDPSDQSCNTVVYEVAGDETGWCTLWFCQHWDTFPRDEGKVLSIKLDEQEDRSPTLLELFLAAPEMELRHAVADIWKTNLKEMVEDLLVDTKMIEIWNHQVRSLWPDHMMWPKSGVLFEGIWRPLLAECLLEDGTWIGAHRTMTLLRGLNGLDNGATLHMTWAKGGQLLTKRQEHAFKNDFKGPSRKWSEYVIFQEPGDGGCEVEVESQWIWQVPGSSAYFVRPNMVPVARALFASYDQFISKFPAYAEQALQRILPKNSSAWKISVLPYKTTDGRHLHRHLKKGEQDRVKVHKGEVATDDAVYNFPRAMEESKHRDEPNFLYNTGLSAANLFLRVLSDVQAMFNIYFANHPDWDQSCESLPARFNLLFESEKVRPTSNWRALKLLRFKKKIEKKMKITHRAKDKVSQRGEELSQDDLAMIEDWHWVGKPRWYFSSDTRADFFTQTPPVHGKDGWATADVSDLDAVMWPHVWCELVEQEWNSMSTELPQEEGDEEETKILLFLSLEELYHKIPEAVKPLMQQYSLDSLGEFLVEMLPGFAETGCPERMKEKEAKAVDYATFAVLAAWDNSITVMENSLIFFQTLVEKLIAKEDELQISGDEDLGSEENSTEAALAPPEGNPKVTRISQLDTIMDTIAMAIEKWRTHGTMGSGLRDSLMQSWDALFKNLTEAETSSTVEARRSFQESRDTLEALVMAQKTRMSEIGDHLERLFNEDNSSADEAAHKAEIAEEIREHVALQYVRVLVQAASQRQTEVLGHFNRISSCIDSISKPKLLPETVFGWTEGYKAGSTSAPKISVEEVRRRMNALNKGQGVDLFFEKACRVSPETNFKIPERFRIDTLREPRSECERVVLSNAFLTMFPNFVNSILYTFWRITFKLERLSMNPSKESVKEILGTVHDFLRKMQQGGKNFYLDDDFYKAFGYRKDGSLFGKLWSNLPSALTEIAATLQTRKDTRTQWITESIAFRSKLKSARRMRVRELEKDKKTIATEVEGCICHEQWTAYTWRKYMPHLETFSGCVENSDQQSLKFVKNSSSWKGFCKTKRDLYSAVTTQCGVKYAECDPEAGSKKPKFQIWRSADVLRADPVRLPLLQLDLYLHVDLRNRRADFCTPNFAPLMLDTNWHWSMSNWLPYDLRRSGCFGARIHPPGFSLQLTMCRHRALGGSSKRLTTEWSMTGVAYLLSHYNVWGTGDGDMTRTWFGGGENWGAAAASQGWPNFLMADPGTWFSSAAGSGYLSTPSVAASPSAFWFGLLAEVISTVSMAEFLGPKNTTSKIYTAKTAVTTAVLVIWRLLQKYAVVPNSWSAFMGTASVLKSLGMKGLLKATGFRNEHDVVLSLKYATQFARRKLDLASLINDMSMDQLREIFFAAKVLGAPVDQFWVNHTSTAAGAPTVVRNMHREMLIDLARSYMQNVKTTHKDGGFLSSEQSSQKQLQELFRRCDGRPLWYKVVDRKSRPLYSFWKRESSAWVQPKLMAGEVLMISKYDDDWYTVIDETHRETRYIPARYLKETAMVLEADVIDSHSYSAGANQIPMHILLDFEIEQVLQQVSVETLECWGNHISNAKPEIFKRIMMEANRKEKKMTPSIFDSSGQLLEGTEVPLGYFSLPYVRTFMSENFGNFLSKMNTSQQESFLKIFGRGKKSRVRLRPQKQSPIVSRIRSILHRGRRDAIFAKEAPSGFKPEQQYEISSSKTSYYDIGLSILTRLGFSFIQLPGIFQLQPYLQLSVQYDVREILRVFKAKVRPGHESRSSKVQKYLRRKRTCEKCIEMNLAFCDRQEAADAMLKKGHSVEMDACEPMDLESKEMCHRFALPEGTPLAELLRGDGLFKKEVCPCYRPVSGMQIVPRWITTKASCADISWPDAEVEALKRASKDRDWSSGFSMQSENVRFSLDEMDKFNSEPPQRQGCLEGYRCCAIFPEDSKKPSKVRCVETKSLFKKSSWIHPTSKCKYFKPKDFKGPWTHAEQHCAADDVDGYWSWDKKAEEWHEESAPEEVQLAEPEEALMGQDDIMDDDDEEELV